MHFKSSSLFLACVIALTTFGFLGCSLRTNETLRPAHMAINPASEGCLTNAAGTLDQFFSGEIQPQALDGFWNCIEKALDTFATSTTGANPSYYTPQELSGFLTKYFLSGRAIPADLVTQAMALKKGLIGGDDNRITKAEVYSLLAILRVLHQETLNIRPIMPPTSANFLARKYTPEQFEASLSLFNASMGRIGTAFANVQGSYSFDQLAALLKAMKSFFYDDSIKQTASSHSSFAAGTWIDAALKYTDALRPAKAIFVAPPKDEIRASDWAKIYELAPKYYGIVTKLQFYAASTSDYSVEPGLSRLESLSGEVVSLMRLVLSHRDNGAISASELDDLYVAMSKAGMLPVKLETARGISRAVFAKVFGQGAGTAQAEDDYTISGANVDRIEDTLLFGTEGLRALNGYYQQKLGADFNRSTIAKADLAALTSDTLSHYTSKHTPTSLEAAASIPLSASGVRTIFPGHANTVYVPAGLELGQLSLAHLAKIHLLRTVNRLLLAGYSANGQFLSETEINTLAGDFFPFLEELGVVTQATRESLPDRLTEASLFLYASDGLTSLSMNEALELESLLISTVAKAATTHDQLVDLCLRATSPKGSAPIAADAPIPSDCYRQSFLAHQNDAKTKTSLGGAWSDIPGLAHYVAAQSPDEQMRLFTLMESFLRKGDKNLPFTKADTQSFTLLPYYVEILFSRFDQNRDGHFDNDESLAAFPVFEPFLKKVCDQNNLPTQQDRKDVFSFLLAYQALPNGNIWLKFKWLLRHNLIGPAKFNVDRGQVVQIFQVLEGAAQTSRAAKN